MTGPRFVVDVERIVVHGIELTRAERVALDGAFRAELERLLVAEPVSPGAAGGAATLRPAPLRLPEGEGPARLGTAVARSVHEGLRGGGRPVPR